MSEYGTIKVKSYRHLEVLEFFCFLSNAVASQVYANEEASDCFCGGNERNNTFNPQAYSFVSFSPRVMKFIETAVKEKIDRSINEPSLLSKTELVKQVAEAIGLKYEDAICCEDVPSSSYLGRILQKEEEEQR